MNDAGRVRAGTATKRRSATPARFVAAPVAAGEDLPIGSHDPVQPTAGLSRYAARVPQAAKDLS